MKTPSKPDVNSGNDHACSDINQFFPYKVCINLDRRADRWQRVQQQFARHGIRDVIRSPAVDGLTQQAPAGWTGTRGAYGCLLSHLKVVSNARDLGAASVLVFEDDVIFDEQLAEKFRVYIGQLPREWDLLYFGALHQEDPIAVTENVCRVQRAYSTYAYALNKTVFDDFLELNQHAMAPVDVNNLVLQTRRASYCFAPHLAWEEAGYSDAQERLANNWYLKESLVLRGSEMDRILQETSVIVTYQNSEKSRSMTQNLLFLARFYEKRLPGINMIIVEEGVEPTIHPSALPQSCQYLWLRTDGPFNKSRCFNAGAKLAPPERKLIVFSDSDVFIEEWDICANLQMCKQYDYVTGFDNLINLTSADTESLRDDCSFKLHWLNPSNYLKTQNGNHFTGYCIFDRQTFEIAGGWSEQDTPSDALKLVENGWSLRKFLSPNLALRLSGKEFNQG